MKTTKIFSVRSSPDPPILKKIAVRSNPDPVIIGFSPNPVRSSPDPCSSLVHTSGVQDPGFGVQSGRILGFFWICIGYRFPFNRIRIRIIQMK